MRHLRNNYFFILIVFSVVCLVISGCGHQELNVLDLLNKPIEEIDHFKSSKKYTKAGITVVYLSGSPYEIGLAHGKLCREEILEINKPIFELYDGITEESKHWWSKAENLEKQIPAEYIEEMHGRILVKGILMCLQSFVTDNAGRSVGHFHAVDFYKASDFGFFYQFCG